MLFHSNIFILYFFPLTLLLFFISNKIRFDSKIILILASLFFYSWWNINYLPLIILSILINFFLGKKIQKSQINKKTPSRSPDAVKALAHFRGSQNGCKYAEAFKVARIII